MAASFFIDAASNAVGTLMVDYLVKPIESLLRYLFRSNKTVEELQEQETKLTVERTRVKRDVDEAKILQPRTLVIEDYAEDWKLIMSYQFLNELKVDKPTKKIKVLISRLWKVIDPKKPDIVLSLEFVATDARKNAIHVYVSGFDAPKFEPMLKEGSLYIINRFQVRSMKANYNPIPAEINIRLKEVTQIEEIHEDLRPFPRHYFNFIPFDILNERIDRHKFLTDVIGVLVSFTSIMKVRFNDRDEVDKREVHIQNMKGQKLKVLLYGSLITQINETDLGQLPTNSVLVLAGTTVKSYKGQIYLSTSSATKMHIDIHIPETAQLKKFFMDNPIKAQHLSKQNEPTEVVATQNRRENTTIAELLAVDPLKEQNTIFSIMVKIVDVNPTNGWFYDSCNECLNSLQFCAGKFWCIDHGEKTPKLTAKVELLIEDDTGEMELVVFGKLIDKLTNASFSQLLLLSQRNKRIIPGPIAALKNQMRKLDVSLTARAIKTQNISYKLVDCNERKSNKRSSKNEDAIKAKRARSYLESPTASREH